MLNSPRTLTGAASLALLLGASTASAQEFSQLPVDGKPAVTSNPNSLQIAADEFSVGSDASIARIRWWGTSDGNPATDTDDFTVVVYETNGGLPGAVYSTITVGDVIAVATGLVDSANSPVFLYEADLSASPLFLGGPAQYFVSIYNNVMEGWYWQRSTQGPSYASSDQGATWSAFPDNDNLAFELFGEEPVGCTFDLVADGGSSDTAVVVGTVTTEFDPSAGHWTVTYQTTGDWWIAETHLDAACDPADFPTNRKRNPQVGKFDYYSNEIGQKVVFHVPDLMCGAGMPTYFAAHAVVVHPSTERVETAWAAGDPFPGNQWATYASCTPPPPPQPETVFAIAFTDVDPADGPGFKPGTDVLIAKLVDGNGDDVLNAGDKVILGQYPLDFDGAAFGTFGVTEHTVAAVTGQYNTADYTAIVVELAPAGSLHYLSFIVDRQFGLEVESLTETASGPNTLDFRDTLSPHSQDQIYAAVGAPGSANSPSAPSIPLNIANNPAVNVDGKHVDVEFPALPQPAPRRVFAVAYADLDPNDGPGYKLGVDVGIARIVDANNDGLPNAGDHVQLGCYPLNFDASAFGYHAQPGPYGVDSVNVLQNGPDNKVLSVKVLDGGGTYDVSFQFEGRPGNQFETFLNAPVNSSESETFLDFLQSRDNSGNDAARVSATNILGLPSAPVPGTRRFRPENNKDNGFVDVEFDLP